MGRTLSRFTALFERLAIDWLKVASQKAVGDQLHLSWDEIHDIMERAVERGLNRPKAELVKHIGIDEKAFRKGHRYLTLVNDLDRSRVLYVAEDRKHVPRDLATLAVSNPKNVTAVGAGLKIIRSFSNPFAEAALQKVTTTRLASFGSRAVRSRVMPKPPMAKSAFGSAVGEALGIASEFKTAWDFGSVVGSAARYFVDQ